MQLCSFVRTSSDTIASHDGQRIWLPAPQDSRPAFGTLHVVPVHYPGDLPHHEVLFARVAVCSPNHHLCRYQLLPFTAADVVLIQYLL